MVYKHYFFLEKKLRLAGYLITRQEVVREVTEGRKCGLTELSAVEYDDLIKYMGRLVTSNHSINIDGKNQIRRKIIVLFRKMGYEKDGKADMKAIYNWVIHYGMHHKKLNKHSRMELVGLVSQVEKVYQSYVKQIHKNL